MSGNAGTGRPRPVMETPRLLIRHFEDSDLACLAALYADAEIRRYFPEGVLSPAETSEELAWFRNGHPLHPELGLWAVIDKASGRFIGRCGLLPWTIDGRHEVEIAYLLDRRYWGLGLASEAARALVRHAFEKLDLDRLIALIDPRNLRSVHVASAAGLAFERHIVHDDMPCALYSIAR